MFSNLLDDFILISVFILILTDCLTLSSISGAISVGITSFLKTIDFTAHSNDSIFFLVTLASINIVDHGISSIIKDLTRALILFLPF
jgi:hypothetical protein